jgi:hypothetical protein
MGAEPGVVSRDSAWCAGRWVTDLQGRGGTELILMRLGTWHKECIGRGDQAGDELVLGWRM